MIGTVVGGRYRVLRKLGEGGMGEVYLVEHVALGRKEALKILRPALAQATEFVQRFRREARATNRLSHANIVSVHDFGQLPDDRFYLAVEYAEGERLDSVLRRQGPLPVSRVLPIAHQLADAIDHAHSRGVIHRDLKPENLVLGEHKGHQDFVKILDFGIAKIIAPDHDESLGTRTGQVFGTPAYMAPEQFRGVGTDPRSDIYGVGCVIFELLVGEPPFRGRSMELMHQHVTKIADAPSARRPQGAIPTALDAVVARCLDKVPERRFQTGRDLIAALVRVPGFRSGRTPSGRRTGRIPVQPPAQDFEVAIDTRDMSGTKEMDLAALDPQHTSELGDTDLVPMADALDEMHVALLELAEGLLDTGASEAELIMGLADVKDLASGLSRVDAEMIELETRGNTLEEKARERQSSLRFAMGELVFERKQAHARGEDSPTDIDTQIAELERRLARMAAEHEREQNAVTDRAVSLAAERARIEDELAVRFHAMAALVEEAPPHATARKSIQRLLARYRNAQQFVKLATR